MLGPQTALMSFPSFSVSLFGLQVLRRPTYKGAVASNAALPMDATTTLGTVLIIASVLPTNTLTPDAVASCWGVLRELAKHAPPDAVFQLLPNDATFALQLRGQMVSIADCKAMFRELDLPWCKSDSYSNDVVVAMPVANPCLYFLISRF